MLILRPALDHLFEKQQENPKDAGKPRRDAPLETLVLCNVAAQCVHSAQLLVAFLDAEIRSQDFLAWWYNVSRMYTSALARDRLLY